MKRLAFTLGLLLCVGVANAITGPSGVMTGNCSSMVTSSLDVPCWDTTTHQWNYWNSSANAIEPVALNVTANPGVPTGADILLSSGIACPLGYTEDTSLAGFYLIPRPIGATVGGSLGVAVTGLAAPADASYTPLGTNAAITAGTPTGTINALTTGADSSTTGGVAKAVAQTPIFTGSALSAHTHTFTGTANTTMRSTIAPGKYVMLCKKS